MASKPCPLGVRCHYAHGKQELRKIDDSLPESAPIITGPRITNTEEGMVQAD